MRIKHTLVVSSFRLSELLQFLRTIPKVDPDREHVGQLHHEVEDIRAIKLFSRHGIGSALETRTLVPLKYYILFPSRGNIIPARRIPPSDSQVE